MTTPTPPPPIDQTVTTTDPSGLVGPLELLLESSAPLQTLLAPQLHLALQGMSEKPVSYSEIIKLCEEIVDGWGIEEQTEFVSAHPRIGEVNNLSALSGNEQQGATPTPGEVLKRLGMLNALYEESFPGLRYITFVNGRSRAEIIPELEGILGINLPPPSANVGEPRLSATRTATTPQIKVAGSAAWRAELKRDLRAMWDIAQARLVGLGVE